MEEAGKDPIKRASLISSIVRSISIIPDAIVRSVYIRECSQLLQMEEKILVEATAKLIEQARENKFKEQQRQKLRQQRTDMNAQRQESPALPLPYPPLPKLQPHRLTPKEISLLPLKYRFWTNQLFPQRRTCLRQTPYFHLRTKETYPKFRIATNRTSRQRVTRRNSSTPKKRSWYAC